MYNKKMLPLIMTAAAAFWGLVAIIMLFVPAVAVKDADATYNGLKIVFGYTAKQTVLGSTVTYTVFNFSFMNLLTYILVLAGLVLSVLNVKMQNKLFSVIAAVVFLVAGIFFFCTVGFTSVNADASKLFASLGSNIKDSLSLAVGAILGGVCSIAAALASIGNFLLKKLVKA
jgi:hypothetical protein